jgi:hypothetical protein
VTGGLTGVASVNNASPVSDAEVHDPATDTWTRAGSLGTARAAHGATLLANGKVLAVGGHKDRVALASAEVYDPNGRSDAPASTRDAAEYLQAALIWIQQNAMTRAKADWAQLRREAVARAAGAKTTADTYPAIRYALERAGPTPPFANPTRCGCTRNSGWRAIAAWASSSSPDPTWRSSASSPAVRRRTPGCARGICSKR